MCGIWLSFEDLQEYFLNISHRGPDYSFYGKLLNTLYLGFHRLAIIDNTNLDNQPFIYKNENRIIYCICNGEIYNYKELSMNYNMKTESDCEIILHLYLNEKNISTLLDGEFAYIIVDFDLKNKSYKIISSRDKYGIRPLFYHFSINKFMLSSEMKGIKGKANVFPPGHISIYEKNKLSFHEYVSYIYPSKYFEEDKLISLFYNAVKKRLCSDKSIEVGCLLSGGLDSSIVAAIANSIMPNIKTFTISFQDGTDLEYANKVAKHINSNHTNFIITPEEALQYIEETIYCIESYDITTVRASVMQFILAKKIKENNPNMKVILTGEFSDELMQGYKYFHLNENPIETYNEALRLQKDVHLFDALRSDRTMAYHHLEIRVPFADLNFTKYIMSLDPKLLNPNYNSSNSKIEKYLFRKCFDKTNLLPYDVLWRSKEAFSNGISNEQKDWSDYIKERYGDEKSYYKKVFTKHFGENSDVIPYYWLPKWCDTTDPSARKLSVYKN